MPDPNATLGEAVSRDLLPFVQNPAQYVGGETNAAEKPWEGARARLCLAFPDTYAVGMSHLGTLILYDAVNRRPELLADRAYVPWTDAADRLRALGLGLFAWESRRPVRDFDVVGVSLQYEMLYTNVLELLDVAGISLRAAERGEGDPLVVAGGPGCDNPEPTAPFFDLMLVGDGEEVLPEVLLCDADLRDAAVPRAERVAELARAFECLYAPALYTPRWHEGGTLAALEPADGAPEAVRAARVADLDAAPFPEAPLVPVTEAIHDRIMIEIMRGCPRRCRFCHAGCTKGRVRTRSPERVLEIARRAYAATGQDEISLLSLSSSDHPQLKQILTTLDAEFGPRGISLSLPSLATTDQLDLVPRILNSVRKSGLTLVPEAAREPLRRVIGKRVDDAHLEAGARAAWQGGWNLIKLYFMIGLPGETEDDLRAIPALARRLSGLRRETKGGPGRVNVAVSNFVPKPHTPLQFVPMATRAYLEAAHQTLREATRDKRLNLRMHTIERSLLEGVLARGDRRVAEAVYHAWKAGARFDAWDETLRPEAWEAGFREAGVDPEAYACRARGRDEVLPWDRIDMGARRDTLWVEYETALAQAEGDA